MNNIRIDYDGRVTAWNSDLKQLIDASSPPLPESEEWGLFSSLPEEAKVEFLESHLGSSHVVISGQPAQSRVRAPRGSGGITSKGRSMVRCAAQALEDRFGLKYLSFVTCTLPPAALAEYTPERWSRIVDGFVSRLRYRLEQDGLCTSLVHVTEIQTQRWEREQGQPPVHLHLLLNGRKPGQPWCFRPSCVQDLWKRSCESELGESPEWSASTRVESLRSSSVSYLGKYMSKGVDSSKQVCLLYPPSAWYGVSTKLKAFVKSQVLKLSGQAAHDLYEYLYSGSQMLWTRDVMSPWYETGTCYLLAWIGALRGRKVYWEILEDIRPVLRAMAVGTIF